MRIVLVVLAGVMWVANFVEAAYACMVANNVPALQPFRWQWTMQTLAFGYPSLRLLLADQSAGGSWGLTASMLHKPENFGEDDHGIQPGTLRYKIEHVVESTYVQVCHAFARCATLTSSDVI